MVEYSYSVFFDPDGTNDDVSLDIEVLELVEVGSGEVTSATIRLNALFGRYLTRTIELSWTGGTGTLALGDIVTTTANTWQGEHIELLSGNSTAGTGLFAENNITFSDVAQTLSTSGGWSATYTTSSSVLKNRPIPDQYERFKVTITDEESNVFTRVYEVDTIVPIQNAQEGDAVEFECLGLEHHLMKLQFAKQFRYEDAFSVAEDINTFYNTNRVQATTQPEVIDHTSPSTKSGTGFNDFPRWNSNFYPFGNRSITCYDALTEMVDKGGTPVTAGGLGDFFEVFYKHKTGNNNQIEFHAFSSGSTGSLITIDNALDVNPAENEGGIENFTGNLIKVQGSENGSLPPEFSTFIGKQEAFLQMPLWQDPADTNQDYPADARVNHAGTVYTSDIANNSSTPGVANWTIETLETFLGPGNYSIWTNNLASETQNSGSNPSPATHGAVTGFNQQGMWDSNMVVADEVNWSFPVQQRIKDTTGIDVNYLYGQATAGTYRGQWFLVDSNIGALGVPFTQNSGNDRFGNAYSDKFVRRNFFEFTGADEFKNWDVVGPLDFKGGVRALTNTDLACVIDEGKIYKFNGTIWEDKASDDRLNHCFHVHEGLITASGGNNRDGFNDIPKISGNYRDNSAIKTTWITNPFEINLFGAPQTTEPFYQFGAWYNIRFPFPYSTHNSVSTLGSLWGSNATKKGPVTIDSKNMHFTRNFEVGYNNDNAEDYGPINSVKFWIRHEWFITTIDLNIPFATNDKLITVNSGNFNYRCALYDTAGNVVVSDFFIPFNDVWAPIVLNIETFKAYRARANIGLGNIRSTLIPIGIEVLNRFDWENIAMCVIQWQESYDSDGRYRPEGSRAAVGALAFGPIAVAQVILDTGSLSIPISATVNLYVDGFHFGKTMMSVTPKVTTGRVVEPETLYLPWIDNKYQLDQLATAQLQIHQFRQNKWIIGTEGRVDVGFGDFFFLKDNRIVERSDKNALGLDTNDGEPNTVKLVAKKITHRIDKPATGVGGFITTIEGAKRFEGAPDN